MTAFSIVMLWLGACWLVATLTAKPLQPDRLEDDLGTVDPATVRRARREAAYQARPWVNLVLVRRRFHRG